MVGLLYICNNETNNIMAIFDIDEMINDPWAGLRKTDAYHKYVLEEVKRLFKGGEIKEAPGDSFSSAMYGYPLDEYDIPTFLFDGREFSYLYKANFYNTGVKMISIHYVEWDIPMLYNFDAKEAKWCYE